MIFNPKAFAFSPYPNLSFCSVAFSKWLTASARPTIPNIPVNSSFFMNPSLTRKLVLKNAASSTKNLVLSSI